MRLRALNPTAEAMAPTSSKQPTGEKVPSLLPSRDNNTTPDTDITEQMHWKAVGRSWRKKAAKISEAMGIREIITAAKVEADSRRP